MVDYQTFGSEFAKLFPELERQVRVETDYLDEDELNAGIVLGVIASILRERAKEKDPTRLPELFDFMEQVAHSEDANLRNAFVVDFIEGIVFDQTAKRYCWPFMGPRTRQLATALVKGFERVGRYLAGPD